jgi:MATE family multidrug resistance protein
VNIIFRYYRLDLKETLHLALPIIVAQLGLVLMGVADTIMVGRVGATELAAAGVSNSVFFLIAVVGSGALSMVSPLVAGSRSHKNKIESPGNYLKASLVAGIWLALATFLVMMVLAWQFQIFRQAPEVEALSRPYLWILAVSVFPMYHFWGAKQFTDGMGEVRISMLITLAGVVTNVFLNWILIFGLWGLPALGLNGAGIATLLSRVLMAFLSYRAIFQSSRFKDYLIDARVRMRLVFKIFKLGLPSGMQYFFEVAAFSGAAIMAGWLGVASLAAHQIAINLASVTYMVAAGFSSAGAIRVGNALGRKNITGVKKAGTTALLLSLGFMTLTALFFILFRSFWVGLYIEEREVAGLATGLLIIAAFFQLSDGVQVVGLGILRGVYDIYIPTGVTLFSYWVLGIPLGYYLSEVQGLGVDGIWYGLLAGLTCSAILLVWRFYFVCKFFPAAR